MKQGPMSRRISVTAAATWTLTTAALLVLCLPLGSCSGRQGSEQERNARSRPADGDKETVSQGDDRAAPPAVTAVQGRSWLVHLGLSDDMGRIGGEAPPAGSPREEPNLMGGQPQGPGGGSGVGGGMGGMGGMMRRIYPRIRGSREQLGELMNQSFDLSGSDLYRLNCQSCHGPKGEGAPPEIHSLIGPVQGASPEFIQDRMKKQGREISIELARQLAAGADSTLRARLAQGGQKMPAFAHLRGDEADALLQYLGRLAGVPSSESPMLVPQSVARVGEHLVKGTCHICHDATGPGVGRGMMGGGIPSLASLPEQLSLQDVVRQVELGSSPMMSMMGGPSMPALPYITDDEAAAAYLYLLQYPPQP